MNNIQKYLNLPFIQKKVIEKNNEITINKDIIILERDSLLNAIKQDIEDEKIFNLYFAQTRVYFLKFSDFYHTIYGKVESDENLEESINLYMMKGLKISDEDGFESFKIASNKLSLASDAEHIMTVPYDKNYKEVKIFVSDNENKIYFLNMNKIENKCFRIVLLDFEENSSIEYIKSRDDIWDNAFLDIFFKFKIFGTDIHSKNLDNLKIFYEKLDVNDTITL